MSYAAAPAVEVAWGACDTVTCTEHIIRLRGIAIAAILVVAAIGCPSGPSQPPVGELPLLTSGDPEAERELREARQMAERGDLEAARERYARFIRERPADPLLPVAQLALGRLHLSAGNVHEARELFAEVARHEDEAIAEQGRFYGGVAAHLAGEHQKAIHVLTPMLGRTIDPADTFLLLRTLATASMKVGDQARALAVLDQLLEQPLPAADKEQAREEIVSVARTATPEQIALAYRQLDHDGAAWPHVARRALVLADQASDVERVREILAAMEAQGIELDPEMEAIAVRAATATEANPRVIGAVLTLSGRAKQVGELALRGIMLAAGLPPSGPPRPDAPRIVFRDDRGDPERAAQAVSELVSVHRVIGIVGPIDASAAASAAARAQHLGVPLVALTPAPDITEHGSMVFRLFPTAQGEARELVAAARARGDTRFAIMRPNGAYGLTLARAFRKQVTEQGGELVAEQMYEAGATSFGELIAELERSSFDALFVADTWRQLSSIAPALAAADLWSTPAAGQAPAKGRAITLLVPSIGFHRDLPATVGRYLQGAVFAVPYDPASAPAAGQDFARRFRTQFGTEPDTFAAFAHDAYALIREAVTRGATSREGVASELMSIRHQGLAGPSEGFDASRNPLHVAHLLELQGQNFIPAQR